MIARRRRRLVRGMLLVGGAAILVVWALVLRPQALGGPAAYVIVSGESMEPRLHDGDLVVAHRADAYSVGDVVAYRVPEGEVGAGAAVIHRIIGGSAEAGYIVKGDNRVGQDVWRPKPHDVIGRMRFDAPRLGRLFGVFQTSFGLAFIAGLAAFFWVIGGSIKLVGGAGGSRGRESDDG
ncbi:MAG: signal peptidase I [Actinobacteria bacterium]|nr:signal peptidase I [Actinomycetota bacterium]